MATAPTTVQGAIPGRVPTPALGEAEFSGVVVTTTRSINTVRSWLPVMPMLAPLLESEHPIVVLYGFGKEHTDIPRSRAAFVVARTGGAPLCGALHEPTGPSAGAPRALSEVASCLSGTFVGWTPSGRCVESASLWDLATARARRVRVSLRAF